jgi:hypothetical protein
MAMKRLAVAFRVLTWLATASLMGIALSSGEASASVAVVDFELLAPGGEFPPVPGGTRDTMGWSFEPNDELSLTHLGFFDAQGDGLDVSHRVGLWTADGDLLAEAYVPSGTDASLLDGYRYRLAGPSRGPDVHHRRDSGVDGVRPKRVANLGHLSYLQRRTGKPRRRSQPDPHVVLALC